MNEGIQVFWEAKELHGDTKQNQISSYELQIIFKMGRRLLPFLINSRKSFYTSAHVLQNRTAKGTIDLRVVIILSDRQLQSEQLDLIAANPPAEGENSL